MIQKQDSEDILLLVGSPLELSKLDEIPRKKGNETGTKQHDTISVIPFSQIQEKGYLARNEGEKILCIEVAEQYEIPAEDILNEITPEKIIFEQEIAATTTTEEYEEIIRKIIDDEIGNGEGANFVIPRNFTGKLGEFDFNKAMTIFKSLVENDYGTYWKYIFYNGDKFFIGSTPERHLQVENQRIKMNPISGTFRKDKKWERMVHFKQDLMKFLVDEKEIDELFMVVDEELKMMARMCDKGGAVIGPLLKEMSQLIHSEYLLSGKSDKDVMELFKDSMFAATVVGSPVENACNIIHRYSDQSRGYYGSALLLLGRDEEGNDVLDSPITIRTAEIDKDGTVKIGAGATLVKDSVPSEELKETDAKSRALMNSIAQVKSTAPKKPMLQHFANDDEIVETLQQRNQTLSNFWFFRQEHRTLAPVTQDQKKLTMIHNEDDFVYMLRHIFSALGYKTNIVSYRDYVPEEDDAAITVIGPGPGNPNDQDSEKIRKNLGYIDYLLKNEKKFLCVCLGHQMLSKTLGFNVEKKDVPLQGVQSRIDLFGTEELVGFYNTFVPKISDTLKSNDWEISSNPENREMYAIKGDNFIGYQFHPESILSKNGFVILERSLKYLGGDKNAI